MTVSKFWEDLIGRVGGPMTFRLILQPTIPIILAIRAGLARCSIIFPMEIRSRAPGRSSFPTP